MRNNIKKILVTGGLGYVGCALVKRLLQIGHKGNILDLGDKNAYENAFLNSYYIITGKKTIDDIVIENNKKDIYFLEDPVRVELTPKLIDELIEHFEGFEEYEKCQELLDLKIGLENRNNRSIKFYNRDK